MSLHCETITHDGLDTLPIDAMWSLFDSHYCDVKREVFEEDLSSKHQVILLWRGGELAGFTSQRFETIDGHRVNYSGDIIISSQARDIGTAYFFHQWAQSVWQKCDWWCSLTSGPRTFRIAHTFYKRVTTVISLDESAEERELRHRFAEAVYGSAYCRDRGIVRLAHPYTLSVPELQIRQNYPMLQTFQQANPGWLNGDELVSLVSLRAENWRPVARRMLAWKEVNV